MIGGLFKAVVGFGAARRGAKKLEKVVAKKLSPDSPLRKGNIVDVRQQEINRRQESLEKRVTALVLLVVPLINVVLGRWNISIPVDPVTAGVIASLVVGGLVARWELLGLKSSMHVGFDDSDDQPVAGG